MLLASAWIAQTPAHPRTPQEIALAAQVILVVMLVGAVGCPLAFYLALRRQRIRQQRERALRAEHGEVPPRLNEE